MPIWRRHELEHPHRSLEPFQPLEPYRSLEPHRPLELIRFPSSTGQVVVHHLPRGVRGS